MACEKQGMTNVEEFGARADNHSLPDQALSLPRQASDFGID